MSALRELNVNELDHVSGGCWGFSPSPIVSWGWGCGCGYSSSNYYAVSLGMAAGTLAANYNLSVDIAHGASFCAIASDFRNFSTYQQYGASVGRQGLAQAQALYTNVVNAISNAACNRGYTKITFPPSNTGGLG